MREKFFNVRASEDTIDKIKQLAEAENRSQGNWLETLVNNEYKKLKGEIKMSKMDKIIKKVIEIINQYDNKPELSIIDESDIDLNGGHYGCRQAVEDYITEIGAVSYVHNRPEGKRIGIKLD